MTRKEDHELFRLEKEKEQKRLKKMMENRDCVSYNFRVPKNLHTKFKQKAAAKRTSIREVLLTFVQKYVEKE